MKQVDTVSVVIVNYNGGELLTQCVQAVLNSVGVQVNIFVVDNASEDNSIPSLQRSLAHEPRLHITCNAENRGFAAASNQALINTTGDYLLYLNPDCIVETDTLARFCDTLNEYPAIGMAGALVCNVDGSEQSGCRRSIPSPWRALVRVLHLNRFFPQKQKFKSFVLTDDPLPEKPVEIEGISGACMFVRRQALEEVGGMDESYFLHCEDLDWFMRFHAQQWGILFIPSITVMHVKGHCSTGEPLKVLWFKHRGMVKFYRKFFKNSYPASLMWAVFAAVWLRFVLLAGRLLFSSSKPKT